MWATICCYAEIDKHSSSFAIKSLVLQKKIVKIYWCSLKFRELYPELNHICKALSSIHANRDNFQLKTKSAAHCTPQLNQMLLGNFVYINIHKLIRLPSNRIHTWWIQTEACERTTPTGINAFELYEFNDPWNCERVCVCCAA